MMVFPTIADAQYGPTKDSEIFENNDEVLEFSSNVIVLSSGTTITIPLDQFDSKYQIGDTINLSGSSDADLFPLSIYSRIYDPNNENISLKKSYVKSDNTFDISHDLGGPFFYIDGIYKLKLFFSGEFLEKYFWFNANEDTVMVTNILIEDIFHLSMKTCEVRCQTPDVSSPPNTTITWFNPDDSFNYITIRSALEFNSISESEAIAPQDVFSHNFDQPGEYVYYVSSSPNGVVLKYVKMMGVIRIDENLEFSTGNVVISHSDTSIEFKEFSSAQLISSSATTAYIKGDLAKVKVPQGTSIPGCEKTLECFIPSNLSVEQGATVMWFNYDNAAHTVTGGSASEGPSGIFDSSLFMAKTTYSQTFDDLGTFEYFCMVHPWMTGIVNVLEPIIDDTNNSSDSDASSIESEEISDTLTIEDLEELVDLEMSKEIVDTTLADIEPILAGWTMDEKTDSEFVNAIKLVLDENLTSNVNDESQDLAPDWIKNDVDWWVDDTISDETLLDAITYLAKENILIIPEN